MHSKRFAVTLTFLFLLLPTGSQAATYSLFATLDGSHQVPANTSLGTGTGNMTYNDLTKLLSWDISFSGLSSGATLAHFHGPALPGANAGPQVTIALGASSGMTSGNLIGTTTLSTLQQGQLLSNLWYVNIHSDLYAGGEIRGQVQAVPLPAAIWLLGSGILGLATWLRRRTA